MKTLHRSLIFTFLVGAGFGIASTSLGAAVLGSSIFPDVPAGSYFDEAVGEMNSAGIINGYDNGNFGPNDPVTRGQVAVLMKRQQDYLVALLNGTLPEPESSDDSSDSDSSDGNESGEPAERDDNPAGSVRFKAEAVSVDEDADNVTIGLIRTGGSEGVVSVDYTLKNGTATSGSDFELSSGRITFAAGEVSRDVRITIFNDSDSDPDETFTVELDNPVGGVSIVDPSTATVTIKDDDTVTDTGSDSDNTQTVWFSAHEYAGPDDGSEVTITLERSSTSGEVSVKYATSPYTASNSDYRDANGTLTFSSGQKEKQFTVFIEDDDEINGDRIVNLKLSDATNADILRADASIRIIDDERAGYGSGSIRFTDDSFEAEEGDGVGYAEVTRAGGADGQVTVKYTTSNGTAISGADYTAQSGSLIFKDGENIKLISVPILEDDINDSGEYLNVKISDPSGASLGSPTSAQLKIR